MARFCMKCGRELPEGTETCPVCSSVGQETDAALFTQITAETEAWKTQTEARKEKPERSEKQKQLLIYSMGAAAFVLLAVLAILYIQPVNRVIRAINTGHYSEAKDIYWSDSGLASGTHDAEIDRALLRAAQQITTDFANQKIDGKHAARSLAILGGIGANAESLLSSTYDEFRVYVDSQDHMAEAEKLSMNGEYLAARDEYLQVTEDDVNYSAAQENAAASLVLYGDSVLSEADVMIQSGDYGGAVRAMEEGKRVLLGYDVYNEKLEFKLEATYDLLEKDLLSRAAAFSASGDYQGAVAVLEQAIEDYGYSSEAVTEAVEAYIAAGREKEFGETAGKADALYEEGKTEEAFALLDAAAENEELPQESVSAAIAALEQRFADDTVAKARTAFARDRDSLPGAITLLNEALHIRRLEAIESYRTEISAYLPANLSEIEYTEKSGTIFRSASEFESLDGTTYTKGWVWGEDGATLTFVLDGGYDLFEGVFTVRKEDEIEAGGWFELLCDGEVVYTSPTVQHLAPETVSVRAIVTGCDSLVIRFSNDYSVRTADDGYCYHGLCDAFLTKNIV